MYLSRKPIRSADEDEKPNYIKQLGLYAFSKEALKSFSTSEQTPLEKTEKIEMMRWIECGEELKGITLDTPSISVDTPEDLLEAEQTLLTKT